MAKKAILGKKVGMTRIFVEEERRVAGLNAKSGSKNQGKSEQEKLASAKKAKVATVVPVTVIQAEPNAVVQIKTVEKDGYNAYRIGFGDVTAKHLNKPEQGVFKKNDIGFKRYLREFELDGDYKLGEIIKVDTFEVGDYVDVSGKSKGKGFQGTIKRYNQHRLKETHGSGPVVRHAGSMGANSDPSRIFKGKRLPGHMGAVRRTVQNLKIIKIDVENNLIAVKGSIPGANGGVVSVISSVKKGNK